MRRAWPLLLSLLVGAAVLPSATGADPPPETVVTSALTLWGTSGTGTVSWTISGEPAGLLRSRIIALVDSVLTVPRGFRTAGNATGATETSLGNGVIDIAEAEGYLALLALDLTDLRFRNLRIVSAAPGWAQGLAGTAGGANDTIVLHLEVSVAAAEGSFNQDDVALAGAPHHVFDFLLGDNLADAACPPACVPFLASNGWRVVDPPPPGAFPWAPGRFVWHGNSTAVPWTQSIDVWEPGAYNQTRFSVDGRFPGTLDLRAAPNARLSFEHTGEALHEDNVDLQIREAGTGPWTSLMAIGDLDGDDDIDNVPLNETRRSVFDLAPWAGKVCELALRFGDSSDGRQEGSGLFFRGFRIEHMPEVPGLVRFHHSETVLGAASFSGFRDLSGTSLVRTPAGELLRYEATFSFEAPASHEATFAAFDASENPQVLVLVLVVTGVATHGLGRWQRKRSAARTEVTAEVALPPWRRGLEWTALGGLSVLYVFPLLPGVFLGGTGLAALGALSVMAVFAATHLGLRRSAQPRTAPSPSSTEPGGKALASKGHPAATGSAATPALPPAAAATERTAQGLNSLFIAEDSRAAFAALKGLVSSGLPGCVFSTAFPEKVRREHGLSSGTTVHWISDKGARYQALDPRRIDFEIARALFQFLRDNPRGVVLLDGLEFLAVANDFEHVLRFTKKVLDEASACGATFLATLSPLGLQAEERALLRKEFDRVVQASENAIPAA